MELAKKNSILIAEDDFELSEIYIYEFKKYGFEVYHAKNGNEVVKLVDEVIPDIVLLDLMMPFLDGFETLSIIKTKLPETSKIIMFSSLGTIENMIEARALGVHDFIIKTSVTPRQLVEKVSSYLNN
ncbi:MAG: response regulator [Candidatus Absconditabacteria bacterium]